MSILDDIVARRRGRIGAEGHALGERVPAARDLPLVPFGAEPFLICEVKRHSPSGGDIAANIDAPTQAGEYASRGATHFSVLTEQDHFHGSLGDLRAVKQANPKAAVLRKDFLLDTEDVDISYRAGADAVLLIAGALSAQDLDRCFRRVRALGMQALVEVHDERDIAKAREIRAEITGINCRDLKTFTIDRTLPIRIGGSIDWPTRKVYESGIRFAEDVRLARSSGFAGVLVGEAVMRNPDLVGELVDAISVAPTRDFWSRLYSRQTRTSRHPLVKICGITSADDARLCADAGADALGFIFAPSPRRTTSEVVRQCDLGLPRVAVVVCGHAEGDLDPEVSRLLAEGHLDAVQFHGAEPPAWCATAAFPYYKALRIRDKETAAKISAYRCPRVLVDAYVEGRAGGTGERVADDLVERCREAGPLWLAGGLGPDNVGAALERFNPELVDASSRLEAEPGRKDPAAISRYMEEIDAHA